MPAIILVRPHAGRQIVTQCCEQCLDVGVRSDMSLAHARALMGQHPLRVEPHRPEQDRRMLRALAAWATRFSPIVAADPDDDGLLIDITGCERLYHGERRLINTVANRLEWLGVRAVAAGAATIGCAWAIARYGSRDRTIVAAGDETAALEPLPVSALRIDMAEVEALHEVGVRTIGELMQIPRLELAARFPPRLLRRLDQALGEAGETIEPVRTPVAPCVERHFEGPVKQLEAILITVRQLIDELTRMLERVESGARRIDLELERVDAEPIAIGVRLSRPSRSGRHLWHLLQPKAERAHLGFGVERVSLAASDLVRLPHEQAGRWRADVERSSTEHAWGELVDTLTDQLGSRSTLRLEAVESHLPERTFHRRSAWDHEQSGSTAQLCLVDRPTLLHDVPQQADVIALTPDGPVCRLRWNGSEHLIVDSIGPERIAGEWWRDEGSRRERVGGVASPRHTRDYFKIQDDRGRWLWVYRELETGRWFVHGEWA